MAMKMEDIELVAVLEEKTEDPIGQHNFPSLCMRIKSQPMNPHSVYAFLG